MGNDGKETTFNYLHDMSYFVEILYAGKWELTSFVFLSNQCVMSFPAASMIGFKRTSPKVFCYKQLHNCNITKYPTFINMSTDNNNK